MDENGSKNIVAVSFQENNIVKSFITSKIRLSKKNQLKCIKQGTKRLRRNGKKFLEAFEKV